MQVSIYETNINLFCIQKSLPFSNSNSVKMLLVYELKSEKVRIRMQLFSHLLT